MSRMDALMDQGQIDRLEAAMREELWPEVLAAFKGLVEHCDKWFYYDTHISDVPCEMQVARDVLSRVEEHEARIAPLRSAAEGGV